MIRQMVKSVLYKLGLKLSRVDKQVNPEMRQGLSLLSGLDLKICTVIDVGAAAGSWTVMAKEFWTPCSFLLFEPLEERHEGLSNIATLHKNTFLVAQAAGKTEGTAHLLVTPDLDGSGVITGEVNNSTEIREVGVTTIDAQVEHFGLQGPYLIKLDTHGYELPILEGACVAIKSVAAIIIECYGFHITEESLLFHEMCKHIEGLGFRLFYIADVMNRPTDGAFWQCDAIFIRRDHQIFRSNKYLQTE